MITCEQAIKNATGKEYSINEIDEYIQQAERIKQRVMNDASISDKTQGIIDALDSYNEEMIAAAKIEKRNAIINQMRKNEAIDFITSQWDDPAEGLQALLVGSERVRSGSRLSVDLEQKILANAYRGGLAHDLEADGIFKMVNSGDLDRDIARALAGEAVTNPDAVKAAKTINKYQEMARRDANKAGAWIKKIDGYITRQTHDADKIYNTDSAEYIEFLQSKLDLDKTLEGVEDVKGFFDSVYKALSTGIHMSQSPAEITKAFKGNANMARKMSEGRLLHFKSADDFMDYNDKYGSGSLIQTVLSGLDSSAMRTGLMRKLGTNPESMVDVLYDNIGRTMTDPKALLDFQSSRGKTDHYMAELTGQTSMAGSRMGAKVSSNLRALQSMSKLGGALLSSISDMVTYAAEVRYQGGSLFSGLGESMQALKKGRADVEHRQAMANLGVAMDSFVGDLASRWQSSDPLNGLAQKAMESFFKWNGLSWWTDAMKRSAAIGTSNRLYQQAGKSFAELSNETKRVMKLYGIDEPEWNIIRQAQEVLSDGTGLLTPEKMNELPDEVFADLLTNQGLKPTAMRIETLKDELTSKLRGYVSDRAGYAQLESDARSRAWFTRGTKRGTIPGETLRFMAQFKQYPTIFLQRTIGREIKGRAKGEFSGSGLGMDSPLYNIASLFVSLTVAGYVAMTAKDLAKGRTPRDPADVNTWLAAAVQGGGAGIYGDFLFGDTRNRFGGGVMDTILGPTLGQINTLGDLAGKMKSGDDFAASGFTFIQNNTPFINMFYTRTALDYLILYDIRESLNPGYLRRMERRVEKENAQEFILPPSENALRPFTGN